ncbi:MAG: hypothetical protein HC916_18365 [Coleofasciculaceae cyanobacterium SM2_1_6]|nr:hypothetical protein [Coleofasciculaceae cyanobacterium SM2_1_6]
MTNGNNGSDRLDLLTEQIALLTEQVSQTSANIDKIGEKIDLGFSELKAIAQAQQHDINRLVGVADKLADTTAQQAKILERLLSDRL